MSKDMVGTLVVSQVLTLVIITWYILWAETRVTELEDKIKGIQSQDFTVICQNFKHRKVTLNYEGYDCVLLGGNKEYELQ